MSGLELDHVVIAAADLDTAARELEERHGLASLPGGRHPDWGTANRIVPLGATYLELIAVVDEPTAARTVPGRWVTSAKAGQPLGWAVRTERPGRDRRPARPHGERGLAGDAGWRGPPLAKRRARAGGRGARPPLLHRMARPRPRSPAARTQSAFEIRTLELEGDPDRLAAWLGDHALPLRVREGSPRVARVVLAGPDGEVVLGAP